MVTYSEIATIIFKTSRQLVDANVKLVDKREHL